MARAKTETHEGCYNWTPPGEEPDVEIFATPVGFQLCPRPSEKESSGTEYGDPEFPDALPHSSDVFKPVRVDLLGGMAEKKS